MLNDTLYHRDIDFVLWLCLTLSKAEHLLNNYYAGACGGHLSGVDTSQNILHAGYYWPALFRDCIIIVQQCHPCQFYTNKMCVPPSPLHPIVSFGPFSKWGIDFINCNPTSSDGHSYIVVVINYFTKWFESIPTFWDDGETMALFLFNQVICHFGVPHTTVTDHVSHFQNHMMPDLTFMLRFHQYHSSSYYPQANG